MRLPLPLAAALALGLAAPALAQTTPPSPAQPEVTAPAAPVPVQTPPAAPETALAAPAPAATPPAASAPTTPTPTPVAPAEAAPAQVAPTPTEATPPAAPASVAPAPVPAQAAPTIPAAPVEATPASPAQAASTVPTAPAPTAPAATPSTAAPAPSAAADTAPAAPPAPADADASTPAEAAPVIAPAEIPPVSLSPQQMFLDADIVVQAVMVGLVIASVLTWTVFLVKLVELAAATRRAGRSLRRIEPAPDLAGATKAMAGRSDPASAMLHAAAGEMARSAATAAVAGPGVKERVASHLNRIEARAGRRIARGTGLLAIVGSTAPFVGLFGTVWGIMNSFIGIAEAQTSNLAVVAPGIAEALLATGLGLVAAIPAVVIYNLLARATAGYRLQLGDASAAVQRLVSRELDRGGAA